MDSQDHQVSPILDDGLKKWPVEYINKVTGGDGTVLCWPVLYTVYSRYTLIPALLKIICVNLIWF
jgi:hypothetical protein